jgi:serine protease Do
MSDNEIRPNDPFALESSQEEKIETSNENGHHQPPPSIPVFNEPIITHPPVESPGVRFTEWTNVDGRVTNPIGAPAQPVEPVPQAPTFTQPPFTDPQGYAPNYGSPYAQGPYVNPGQYPPVIGPPADEPPIPARKNKATMWIAIGVIALLLFSSILAIQAAFRSKPTADAPALPPPGSAKTVSAPSPTELSVSFREIAKNIKPAVVFIRITGESEEDSQNPLGGFGLPQQRRRQQSAGSGVIVTQDGYIITNNHVVQNATKIDVTLSDNRKYKALVIGTDPETDLAVIKIDDNGLPTAVLGNSDEIQQGDWVLALGSPFGLQQTLTAGIVSATGREFGGNLGKFIQTDASINPGNSGGPLIGMNGEVVGINSFIIPQQLGVGQGGSLGIGFAVTSNVVRSVFGEIAQRGKVSRGFLGVNPVELDDAKAHAYGVEAQSGVLIQNVIPDTPADKAGLRSGDIVTAFEGKKVKTPSELTEAVASTPVGKSCKVDYIRDGNPESVNVVLADRTTASRANNNPAPTPSPESSEQVSAGKLGVSVQTVTSEIADRLNLRIKTGVLVRTISANSPLAEVLRHGDVIHRIDKIEVRSAEDLLQAEKSLKDGDDIAIQIERGGNTLILTVTL